MTTTELVKSISIENMINQRNAVIERLSQAVTLIIEAKQLAKMANVGFPYFIIEHYGRRNDLLPNLVRN